MLSKYFQSNRFELNHILCIYYFYENNNLQPKRFKWRILHPWEKNQNPFLE